MNKYLVLYFLQSEVGKLQAALNTAAEDGYVFKTMLLDLSQRTIVVMELEPKPRLGRPPTKE